VNLGGLKLLALPFTATSHTYDPEEVVRRAARETMPPDMVVGHLSVEGVQLGEETTDMPRGRDIIFPREVLRQLLPSAFLANGHYHKMQVHDGVHIPGSLARLTFGAVDHKPGFMIVEVR
jgi:hypothetical protein